MKRIIVCLAALIITGMANMSASSIKDATDKQSSSNTEESISSPNGEITLTFLLNEKGEPYYTVSYKGEIVVRESRLGFILTDGKEMKSGFVVESVKRSECDTVWKPIWGEVNSIRDNFSGLTAELKKDNGEGMTIHFKVYNDGIGFRYEFDKNDALSYFRIKDELTEFAMTADHRTFWIPGAYDSNEFPYSTTRISEIDAYKVDGSGIGTNEVFADNAIQSPVMLKSDNGLYINIFEASLVDYPAMQLSIDRGKDVFTASLVPDAYGIKAYLQTPCRTPWRVVLISDKATDILASKTILNLNDPCKLDNFDYIKPQKYIGIWWEMHVPDRSSWNYADMGNIKLEGMDWNSLTPNGRHGATTSHTKEYIDFAAENGFASVLVEGWNVGWEDWSGNWKEEVFDFISPYPDFDVAELSEYAKSKGVGLIMHHETSGSVTNYERRIDGAIDFMKQYDYGAVKTGYVGKIIPRGEKHDGQWMVNHYNRVIKKMADNNIMLVAHEPVRPTGLHRTYPNLMACEAARGNEFNAWSAGNPPEHETILPFTRLMGGPMDYTPGIFEIKMDHYQAGNKCQVHTTLAKQLALYVTMYSPIQMAADLIENYRKKMDAFQFIKDVDVDWDNSVYLEAEPGDYITVARKSKGKEIWFVGAITDENSRTALIDCSFLAPGVKYTATVYADADDADWQKNPMSYCIYNKRITSKSTLKIKLAPGGGCAIKIVKVN